MAEQAYVYIKNRLKTAGSIQVFRKLPDGNDGSKSAIGNTNQEKIALLGIEEWIELNAPEGMDPTTCVVSVKSDVDVAISYSLKSPNWTIKITPNDASANTPTTVNVTVGTNEPE